MANLPQFNNPAQANAPLLLNSIFIALEHEVVYAMSSVTTTGLIWGYFGGRWGGFAITASTLTLTASTTNYIVVAIATGGISTSTTSTNWNDATNYARVYKVTTNTTQPVPTTGVEDHRAGTRGVHFGAGGSTVFTGGTLSSALNEAPPVTLASAASVAIGAAAANSVTITGTTAITSFDTVAVGAKREITFSGVVTLTHNATSLILPTSANITTSAGDVGDFVSLGSGNWKCVGYTRANGTALSGSSFTGGTLTSALNEAPTVTIASSATPAIGAAAGNSILLTGTTTVTGFDTIAAGAFRRVRFSGALVLTYNATSLILPTSANITTAANDVAEFLSLGAGNWFCTSYTKASGAPLVAVTSSGGGVNAQTGTSYTVVSTDNGKLVTFSNAAATAVTLPQATGSFASPWYVVVRNINYGVVTITPTTSTIQGLATLVLRFGESAYIYSDGTNYTIVFVPRRLGVVTLTSGATVTPDLAKGDNFRVVLGVNATLANPTNLQDGDVWNARLIQDATGGRTLAYGTMYKFPGGAATLSTAANARDFLSCEYDAADSTIYAVLNKAFA